MKFMEIRVTGDKGLNKYVKGLKINLPKGVEKGSDKWGRELQKSLRRVAPKWTGALKDSIQWRKRAKSGVLDIANYGILVGIMKPHAVPLGKFPIFDQWAEYHGLSDRKWIWVTPQRSVGNPWFRNTIEMSLNRLHQGLDKEVSRSIRRTK